jgi:hypothetical protein
VSMFRVNVRVLCHRVLPPSGAVSIDAG